MRFKNIVIQLFIILPLFSNNNSFIEIDSILNESFQKFAKLQFIESSNFAQNALELSVSSNYSKGTVMSNLYVAKVLLEIGLTMDALQYIETIIEEPYFKKNVIPQVEYHRLKGRIYGSQQIYTLAKEEFNKQLILSENIADPKKRVLSKIWAYQNIEHLYFLQEEYDSIEVYQNLQEELLKHLEEHEAVYNISTLYSSKGRLYLHKGKFDAAAVELQNSIEILEKYNIPYKYHDLRTFGDLEAARGNIGKAISYYTEALENSVFLNATSTTRDLHKRMAEYMLKNDTLLENAKIHGIEYTILYDSLEKHNNMVADVVLQNIIKGKDAYSAQKSKLFRIVIWALIFASISIGAFLIARNRNSKNKLIKKDKQLTFKTEQIGLLEEELESNIFNDIIELAKNNSPEFLPLFGEMYPEFVEAMKQLDPDIRSSELYFCALAYLNFSTKDIANFTFVTIRAVQVRKNRMRKKYNINSEIDFNEWFRSLENGGVPAHKRDEE